MSQPPPISLPPITGPSQDECDLILGTYIRAWGQVEMAMAEVIRRLLDSDMTTTQIIIRSLNDMRMQRELANELGKHRLQDKASEVLERLLDRVKSAATRRNRIVHGIWFLSLEMGSPPNPTPLTAKTAKFMRLYRPAQQDEFKKLMEGKSQKLNAAYKFWPDQIVTYASDALDLTKDLVTFANGITLKAPVEPPPVKW